MEIPKNYLQQKIVKNKESKIKRFQEVALEIIKTFGVEKEYIVIKNGKKSKISGHAIIFKFAKRNLSYLEGKIAIAKEKFGENTKSKAGYLIALLLKKPNWK